MKKIIWTIVILVIVGLVVWGVYSNNNFEVSDGSIRIGAILAQTGSVSSIGERVMQGFQTLSDVYKVKGYDIEFVYEDDSYDPKKTVSAYNLLKQKNLNMFLSMGSGPSLAIADLISQNGDVLIGGATAVSYSDTDDHNFRVALNSDQEGPLIAKLLKESGINKLAILVHPSDYGNSYLNSIKNNYNGEIVLAEQLPTNSDYSSSLIKVKDSGADGLFFIDLGTGAIQLLNKRYLLGNDIKIFSHQWVITPDVIKETGENSEGLLFSAIKLKESDFLNDFNDFYQEKYNKLPSFDIYTYVEGADVLIKSVINTDGTPEAVKKYMLSHKFEGFTGDIEFLENGDRKELELGVYRVTNGLPVLVN